MAGSLLGRRSGRPWGFALGVALALGPAPAPADQLEPPQRLPVAARWCLEAERCIGLEVAATPRQQAMGLQLRPPLPPLRGMWFPYAMPTPARFWMHRTPAPLDMLFIRDGRVVAIEAHAQPCMRLPCRSYGPDQAVDGVLELAAGQAEALGITVGSPVRIEPVGAQAAP
jgi:uncharacterized membrane protein (UPF0127 family)